MAKRYQRDTYAGVGEEIDKMLSRPVPEQVPVGLGVALPVGKLPSDRYGGGWVKQAEFKGYAVWWRVE